MYTEWRHHKLTKTKRSKQSKVSNDGKLLRILYISMQCIVILLQILDFFRFTVDDHTQIIQQSIWCSVLAEVVYYFPGSFPHSFYLQKLEKCKNHEIWDTASITVWWCGLTPNVLVKRSFLRNLFIFDRDSTRNAIQRIVSRAQSVFDVDAQSLFIFWFFLFL